MTSSGSVARRTSGPGWSNVAWVDDLFDLSLLAAYESLGVRPVPSAWTDLYKTAVLKAVSRGIRARLQPEAALAEAIALVVDQTVATMPGQIGDRVSAVAVAQVQYLAARHQVTQEPAPKPTRRKRPPTEQRVKAKPIPKTPEQLHVLGPRVYDLVLQGRQDGALPLGPDELARLLGEHPAEVKRAVELLASVGWLKKGLWGVKPGHLVWKR